MNLFDIAGSRSLAAGVAVSAASVVLPVVLGNSETSARVDMLDGTVWLASEAAGNVVRVNGETGRVDARLDLGQIAGELLVDQGDGAVLVSFGNEVRSIDLANLDWGAATDLHAGTGVVVGDGAAFMVSQDGEVRELDPSTLETIGEVDLEAAPIAPSVVAEGRLVVPVDDGTVRVVDGDDVTAAIEAGEENDAVRVTRMGDTVAVLNQTQRTVRELDAADGDARDPVEVELPTGELLVPTELTPGHLWVTATRSGELAGVHLDGEDPTVTVPVADARHQLTAPVVAGERVYLVDRTAGEIVAVDATTHEVVHREPLEVPDPSQVELLVEGDTVFVNDPNSKLAIVIDGDEYIRVDKYSDEGVAAPSSPAADPDPAPATQAPAAPQAPAPPPPEPPAAPATVTATPGNGSATVSWQPGGGGAATSYHVAYEGGGTVDVPAGQVSVTVDGLTNGDTYVFEVWASNEHGESPRVPSNEVVPNDEVPGAPTRVVAEDGDASAVVRWSGADGRGNDITAYVIEASPATVPPLRVSGDDTSAEVTGLTNETPYTFTVRAVNDLDVQSEPSPPSNEVTPWGPPSQVPSVTKTEEANAVALDWEPATGREPISYVITATPSVGDPVTVTDTWHRFEGLTNGTSYTFTIVARNERGDGPPQQVQATPGSHPQLRNVAAERTGDRRFRVTFDVDDGGRPIDSCTVSRGGGGSVACDLSGGSGSATLDVPQFNTQYTFTVTAANEMGEGTGTASGRSAGKPLTVDANRERWDGACTWFDGQPNTRPYFSSPNHTCPAESPGPAGYLRHGTAVRAQCWQNGESVRDDHLNASTVWIRVEQGWMNAMYFSNWSSNPEANLPRCS
ncbi:MAG TPA: fibronectin type III domain-containing protein [Acidimicrobiales bacterium]